MGVPCCAVLCPQGYARRAAEESLDAGQGFTVELALKDVRWGHSDPLVLPAKIGHVLC